MRGQCGGRNSPGKESSSGKERLARETFLPALRGEKEGGSAAKISKPPPAPARRMWEAESSADWKGRVSMRWMVGGVDVDCESSARGVCCANAITLPPILGRKNEVEKNAGEGMGHGVSRTG